MTAKMFRFFVHHSTITYPQYVIVCSINNKRAVYQILQKYSTLYPGESRFAMLKSGICSIWLFRIVFFNPISQNVDSEETVFATRNEIYDEELFKIRVKETEEINWKWGRIIEI